MMMNVNRSIRPAVRRMALRFKSATSATESASSSAASSSSSSSSATAAAVGKTDSTRLMLQSAVAAGAGIVTVSIAALCVEQATAHSVPTYHPKRQRFDPATFGGRFAGMLLACDPRLLLYNADQVKQAQALLENYETSPVSDRALWEAKRVVTAALHPDTGDVIPRPFRMSGYVPYNGPICVAMVGAQSTTALLFWSWVNQSQNALVNYFNRNASSPMSNETLAISYGAAVGSALAVAYGLSTLIQRRFPPARAQKLLRWVAFPSAVVASSLNCYIVRSPEIQDGVPLVDANGNDVLPGQRSHVAAAAGVYSTTASRAILQAPVYFVPPLLVATLPPLRNIVSRKPHLTIPLTTYCLLVSFGLGLPATVAIFPQQSPIRPADVETKFQHLRDPSTGQPYEVYYYNKGL